MSIKAFFHRFTNRDPKAVTPMPYVDTRSQDELDALKIAEWRAAVRANEMRREQQKALKASRAEQAALRYLQQA